MRLSACGFTSTGGSGETDARQYWRQRHLGTPCWATAYQPGSRSLGGGLVLLGHARGDAPAVADRDALVFCPGPDVRAALPAGCGASGSAPLSPASPAGVFDERRELPAEHIGVFGAQVDLVVGTAEPESHRLI